MDEDVGKPFVNSDRFLVIEWIEDAPGRTTSGPPVKPLAKWGMTSPTVILTSHAARSGSNSTLVPAEVFPSSANEAWEGSIILRFSPAAMTIDMRVRMKTLTLSIPSEVRRDLRAFAASSLAIGGTMG